MKLISKSKGFSLIELSISLVILGLVLSGGLLALKPLFEGARINDTKNKLENIKKAISAYVLQRGFLPCPAPDVNSPEGVCASQTALHGILPWRALGLMKSEAKDGWGRMFSYSVDGNYINSGSISLNCTTNGIPTEDWTNFASNISLIDETGSPPISNLVRPVYLVISHGKNGYGATMPSGANFPIDSSTSFEERSNLSVGDYSSPTTPPAIYYSAIPETSTSVGFDDIIVSKSAARIMIDIGCSGR